MRFATFVHDGNGSRELLPATRSTRSNTPSNYWIWSWRASSPCAGRANAP